MNSCVFVATYNMFLKVTTLKLVCLSVLPQYAPENEPMWEPHPNPYRIEVRDPEKKSKFKGIKTFTAYSVIPTVSVVNISQGYFQYKKKLN